MPEGQGLVQQFFPQTNAMVLDVAVPHWLVRRDVVPSHAELPAPYEQGIAGNLRAWIAVNQPRRAALCNQLGQSCLRSGFPLPPNPTGSVVEWVSHSIAHTEIPILRALSTRLALMPLPGQATTALGSTSSI